MFLLLKNPNFFPRIIIEKKKHSAVIDKSLIYYPEFRAAQYQNWGKRKLEAMEVGDLSRALTSLFGNGSLRIGKNYAVLTKIIRYA